MGQGLTAELQKTFSTNTREHWIELVRSVGVIAGPCLSYAEVAEEQRESRCSTMDCFLDYM